MIKLLLFLSYCFSDSNTLSTATGVVDASELNQFRSALNSTLMPRNSSGVVADLAASLGSSTYRFDSSNIQKIFLGTASQNVFIDGSGADLRFYVSNTKEASVTSSGVEGSYLKDISVTQGGLNNGNYSISSSCGAYQTTSTSYVAVTNLSASITATGRPVRLMLNSDGVCHVMCGPGAGTSTCAIRAKRDSTVFSEESFESQPVQEWLPCGNFTWFDTPSAGTYTYSIEVKSITGSGFYIDIANAKLVVWEI